MNPDKKVMSKEFNKKREELRKRIEVWDRRWCAGGYYWFSKKYCRERMKHYMDMLIELNEKRK